MNFNHSNSAGVTVVSQGCSAERKPLVILVLLLATLAVSGATLPGIVPLAEKVICSIPACRLPGRAGALVYQRGEGINEFALGILATETNLYLWDATRALCYDKQGRYQGQYLSPVAGGRLTHLAVSPAGDLLLAVASDPHAVYRYHAGEAHPTRIALPEEVSARPEDIVFDAKHRLWVRACSGHEEVCFDDAGRAQRERRPWRLTSGQWGWQPERTLQGLRIAVFDETGGNAATLDVPQSKYPYARVIHYFDGQPYLGVFGHEPEAARTLTLYTISPAGLAPKATLPASVLFGGQCNTLCPDGCNYSLHYDNAANVYHVKQTRYSPQALGLKQATLKQ